MELNADIEMEKQLLSALMLDDGTAIPKVAEILKPEDFYRPEHRLVYQALLNLSDGGAAIGVLVVVEEIKRMGKLKGDMHMYVLSLTDYAYSAAAATQYAAIIKRYSKLRRLAELGRILMAEANNAQREPEEIQAIAEQRLTALNEGSTVDGVDIADLVRESVQVALQKDSEFGLSTGLMDMDRIIGGLKKTDLLILAARPSMGKTALALNIAAHVAKEYQVLMFSLEMGRKQLTDRVLAFTSRLDSSLLRGGRLTKEEVPRLLAAAEDIERLNLKIDDTSGISLFEVRQRARRMKRERGLDLIVIDYLQLMQASNKYGGNRVQEVSELSRGLKGLAKELDIPVLALSQLSRAVELRSGKHPQLSDLRESGSIEQDADIVMLLYREGYYDKDTDNPNIAEVSVAKNRNGQTARFRLFFEPACQLFGDLAHKVDWE